MAHLPVQIGTRDAEGYRTFAVPGDVCAECSDFETGRMVPISFCPRALAAYDREAQGTLIKPWEYDAMRWHPA